MRGLTGIISGMLTVVLATSTAFASFFPGAPGRSEPQGLRWKDRVIRIGVSTSLLASNPNIKYDSDVQGAIRRSIAAWEQAADVKIEFEVTERANVSPNGASGDGVSLITIAPSPENLQLFAKDPQSQSAKTRVFYNSRNFITEADIVLNPYQQFSMDGTFGTFDLETTLTHELGHLLGLRHSSVLGATMSGTLPKNGTFGIADLAARTLSDTDVAAIRDLYGAGSSALSCCGSLAGRLSAVNSRSPKTLRVWAEDNTTGKVAALSEVAADGTFKLGGLNAGAYSVFWQYADGAASSVSVLGAYRIEKGEARLITERITLERPELLLSYIGLNNQLTDSAVSISAGREHTIYLGGRNLDPARLAIEFNSPYITVDPASITTQDFGSEVSAVSFVVSIHPDTPAGAYSIFASGQNRTLNALLGAINIQ